MKSGLVHALCALTLVCGTGAQAQVSVDQRFAKDQPTLVLAHRSAEMAGLPENTIAWINHAIALGVDAVHINPQRTADGHYVLMHDNTLNRTTDVEEVFPEGPSAGPTRLQQGGRDYVGYYSLDEIRRLHVVGGPEDQIHTVPTLQEALDAAGGRALVFLGLKSYEVPTLAQALEQQDKQNLVLFDLFYSGTDQSKLRALAEATGIPVDVALYHSRDYLRDLNDISAQLGPHLAGIHVNMKGLTAEFSDRMNELDLRLFISGWDSGEDYALTERQDPGPWQKAIATGFGVLTDQPAAVLKLLGR